MNISNDSKHSWNESLRLLSNKWILKTLVENSTSLHIFCSIFSWLLLEISIISANAFFPILNIYPMLQKVVPFNLMYIWEIVKRAKSNIGPTVIMSCHHYMHSPMEYKDRILNVKAPDAGPYHTYLSGWVLYTLNSNHTEDPVGIQICLICFPCSNFLSCLLMLLKLVFQINLVTNFLFI